MKEVVCTVTVEDEQVEVVFYGQQIKFLASHENVREILAQIHQELDRAFYKPFGPLDKQTAVTRFKKLFERKQK
jgi:hypothetical protein